MRVLKRRNTNETYIEYENRRDIQLCRYRLLKMIIASEPDVTLIVDTNQRVGEKPFEIEGFLDAQGIAYSIMPIKPNKSKFLGFSVEFGSKKKTEKILAAQLSAVQFSKELYDTYLDCYDIGIGIGRQKPLKEVCELLSSDEDVLFNPQVFMKSIYDSVVCSSVRSTMDIGDYVEAVKHEVAL